MIIKKYGNIALMVILFFMELVKILGIARSRTLKLVFPIIILKTKAAYLAVLQKLIGVY